MKQSQIPAGRWIGNLLDAARLIADRKQQEERWLNPDRHAWENPNEALNVLDDCVFEGFIEFFAETFSPEQAIAITEFRDHVNRFCAASPRDLNPAAVLIDPQWKMVRQKAAAFIEAFSGKWPN